MTTPRLKETDYLIAWGLFAICAMIGGMVAGAIVGAVLGAFLGVAGASMKTIKILCGTAGFIAGLPVSYICFRVAVSRFIVRKLTDPSPSTSTSTEATPTRLAA